MGGEGEQNKTKPQAIKKPEIQSLKTTKRVA